MGQQSVQYGRFKSTEKTTTTGGRQMEGSDARELAPQRLGLLLK